MRALTKVPEYKLRPYRTFLLDIMQGKSRNSGVAPDTVSQIRGTAERKKVLDVVTSCARSFLSIDFKMR
jgi:hypothetical protein